MSHEKKIVFTQEQFRAFHQLMAGRFESTGHSCLFLASYVGKVLGSAASAGVVSADEGLRVVDECVAAMRSAFELSSKGGNGKMASQG